MKIKDLKSGQCFENSQGEICQMKLNKKGKRVVKNLATNQNVLFELDQEIGKIFNKVGNTFITILNQKS